MTSVMRRSVPRSRPLTTDRTSADGEMRLATRPIISRRCADGTATMTRSVASASRPASAVTWIRGGRSMPGQRACGCAGSSRGAPPSRRSGSQEHRLGLRDERARASCPRRRSRSRRRGRPVLAVWRRRRSRARARVVISTARFAGFRPFWGAIAGRASRFVGRAVDFARAARLAHGRPLAEDEPDRRAEEPELVAQPVLEVAPVEKWTEPASRAKNTNVGGATATCVA